MHQQAQDQVRQDKSWPTSLPSLAQENTKPALTNINHRGNSYWPDLDEKKHLQDIHEKENINY